jgi:CheY-like chemotaxis protein
VRALAPDRGGTIPAAAFTAHAARKDAERILASGFQVHLPKPISRAELVEQVAKLAGRSVEPS